MNECEETKDNCDKATTTCFNFYGDYMCLCKQGYAYVPQKTNICQGNVQLKEITCRSWRFWIINSRYLLEWDSVNIILGWTVVWCEIGDVQLVGRFKEVTTLQWKNHVALPSLWSQGLSKKNIVVEIGLYLCTHLCKLSFPYYIFKLAMDHKLG